MQHAMQHNHVKPFTCVCWPDLNRHCSRMGVTKIVLDPTVFAFFAAFVPPQTTDDNKEITVECRSSRLLVLTTTTKRESTNTTTFW